MLSTEIENFRLKNKYPDFNPKAIFFDMDGVLFDSMKFHASSWVKAMQEVGLPFTENEAYMNEGRTGTSTIDNVFIHIHDRNATEKEKKQIYKLKSTYFEECGKIEKMPFALDLLNKIKSEKKDIFVVTGSGQPSLIDSLQENFPDIFVKEKMVTAFDVTNGKPHPEPYLKALKKSKLKPWEVIVVENAPLGVESAAAAGLFTVAVNTGPLDPTILKNSGANLVLRDVKELFENWEKLFY